uniref:Reverse transcriptase domain-containing protein n=1 Tax=Amphimedon queenslandica TaxID=400682 RepID=A0A1X7U9Q9_AMPQE
MSIIRQNQATTTDTYPLPRIDDLLASFAGGQHFLRSGPCLLADTVGGRGKATNTHRGLYQHIGLPFGVLSAPATFQRTIKTILQGLPKVFVYIDDILVTGQTEAEHLKNLDEVLGQLEKAGVRLKKCSVLLPELETCVVSSRPTAVT